MTDELIDHPKHYNHGDIEPIDVIEDWKLGCDRRYKFKGWRKKQKKELEQSQEE